MKIALCQILSSKDVAQNLATVRDYTALAASRGAELVVFPEATMVSFGGSLYDAAAQHEYVFRQTLRDLAVEHSLAVVAGGFAPVALADEWDLRVHNNLYAYDQNGQETVYTKIHLYDAFGYRESDAVKAGEQLRLLTVRGVKVGLATCYDVRFPKLFAEYARAGAQVAVVAASWAGGEGKADQWRILTSARALDSNLSVVAVDQASPVSANPLADVTQPLGVGFSRAVDPWGRALVEAGEAPELVLVDIDTALTEKVREALPVLENAKLGY